MLSAFKFYKQHDQMDCGPTCLRMIAQHYGKKYSLHFLRQRSFITREGVSLSGLSKAAEEIGFRTIGVKLPFEKLLKDAPLPCIVHWNQNHFIVVYKITKSNIYVADPASGLLNYKHDEFKALWAFKC